MSYILHNDEPTLQDKLSRKKLVNQIVEVAVECKPPQVLGIHGDWGAGKTSILELIYYNLTGNKHRDEEVTLVDAKKRNHVMTIWFDAWQYQNESVPVVALLQEMRRQLGIYGKIMSEAGKIAEVTLRSLLYGIDNIAKLIKLEASPFSPDKIQSTGEKWEKEHLADRLATDTIQHFLQEAITQLLPNSKSSQPSPRLVIIIDDIDRCNPTTAYRLLEGLKNYLILPNCIFILGMNQQIVTEAISNEIGNNSSNGDTRLRAEAYLEKMCSNIWRLPLPKNPAKFLTELLSAETKEVGDAIVAEEGKLKVSFLPPNPRRLKALANLLNRMWPKVKQYQASGDLERKLGSLIVAYVYQFHSDLFQRWHYDPNFLKVLSSWVDSGMYDEEHKPFLLGLILPTKVITSGQEPAPVVEFKGAYPDPTAPGIFWIAPLLQKTLHHLTPTDYSALLRFEDTP